MLWSIALTNPGKDLLKVDQHLSSSVCLNAYSIDNWLRVNYVSVIRKSSTALEHVFLDSHLVSSNSSLKVGVL